MSFPGAISTSRGVRVSHARGCRVQASGDVDISAHGDPVPFGALDPLRARAGVHLKYMRGVEVPGAVGATGHFWIRGDPEQGGPPGASSPRTAYPIYNEAAAPVEKRRARKLIFLPITSQVPVYCQIGLAPEGTTALEF